MGVAVASPPELPPWPDSADRAQWLRSLDRRAFGQLITRAYEQQGYAVLPAPGRGEDGIDLTLTRGTERILVTCKHHNADQVDARVVRELVGLVAAHGATWGIVATSGTFSEDAEAAAHKSRVTLLDGRGVGQLITLASVAEPSDEPPLSIPSPVPAPRDLHIDPSCPICMAPMMLRTTRRGPAAGSRFWSCTRSPGCEGVRPAPRSAQSSGRRKLRLPQRTLAAIIVVPVGIALALGGVVLGSRVLAPSIGHPGASPLAGAAAFGKKTMDVAYDPTEKVIYSANYASGDITVANAKTLAPIRTIEVAGKPIAVASDGQHHRLYVADGSAKKVYVVDTRNGHTVGTMATKAKPSDLAVDPARQRLFVVSKAGNLLEVFNTATKTRLGSRTTTGHPSAVAVNPTTHQLYVAAGSVTVHNGSTLSLTQTLRPSGKADGLSVDPRANRIYLTGQSGIQEYNLTTHKTRRLPVAGSAAGIALDPAKHRAYVAIPGQNTVAAISVK